MLSIYSMSTTGAWYHIRGPVPTTKQVDIIHEWANRPIPIHHAVILASLVAYNAGITHTRRHRTLVTANPSDDVRSAIRTHLPEPVNAVTIRYPDKHHQSRG